MTEAIQNQLREALLNNSYDHESTHLALKKEWENSFSYLYRMQIEKILYDEYHYYSNDATGKTYDIIGHLYLDNYIRACFDIDKDIIHVCDREEFKRSNYYLRYFTLQEMINDGHIFQWIPIVIIDDQVVWDWELKVISKDAIQFRMPKPFRRQFVLKNERDPVTDEIIYVDHKVQVFVVQNDYFERLTLNRMNLYLDNENKTIKIQKEYLKEKLPGENKEGIYFVTLAFPDDGLQAQYLYTQLVDLYENDTYFIGTLPDPVFEKVQNYTKDISVTMVYVNELHRHIWYTGSDTTTAEVNECNMMVINRDGDFVPYASPIPVENFMVFRTKKDETIPAIVPNHEWIRLYYPNIYRITNKSMVDGDSFKIFYFYHYNTYLKYTCIHDFWYRFLKIHFTTPYESLCMEEIIDRVWRGKMNYPGWTVAQIEDFTKTFEKILFYLYKRYKYAENDFLYNYLEGDSNPYDFNDIDGKPFMYKQGKLKEWIRDDPWLLRDYVLEQKKVGRIYHLFTNQLDLSSRLRTNTNTELHYDYEFDEPMYVFALNNTREYPVYMDIRFFVDGIFAEKMYQDRYLFMDYLYVPASMVTDDSYLEIEVFPRYDFKQPVRFESMDDVKEVTLVEPDEGDIWPTYADAYLMLKEGEQDEYTHLYENSLNEFFKVTSCYTEGEWEVKTVDEDKPIRFTRLRKFKLQPTDESVLNKDINLCINKHPIGLPYQITTAGYPYLQLVGAENKFHYSADYIRVYRNGRLLPNVKWCFYSSFECPRIQMMEWFDVGDTIYFDITPFRYKMIYYQEELEWHQTLIDLRNIITKPFDWRYYDVYMNGRRLSMNNLFSITPWEMTMVNLKSKYNLAIYEKERDWEYYGLNYKENIYFFTPDDLFKKDWVSEDEKNQLIKDIIDAQKDPKLNIYPNTNEEPKQDWSDERQYVLMMAFYWNELIPKTFVNPSVLQFNKRIISEEYPTIYDNYVHKGNEFARTEYEKETLKNAPEAMLLDPNFTLKGENRENLTYVYMVGHPLDDAAEYVDETITINNSKYKIGGD